MDGPYPPQLRRTTPRLVLYPLPEEDVAVLISIASDTRVSPYLWDSRRVASTVFVKLRRASDETFSALGFGLWSVRENGRCIGACGLQRTDDHGGTELVYLLSYDRWGNSLAFEATRSILSYAFLELRLDRIRSTIHPDNVRSRGLLRRLGMVPAGTQATPTGTLIVHSLSNSLFQFHHGDLLRAGAA